MPPSSIINNLPLVASLLAFPRSSQAHNRSAMQILCLWALNRGLVIFPDLDHVKNAGLFKTAEEFDAWRVKLSGALNELSLLLSPLFRKKPLWKEAFCLHEKEEER